MKGTKGVWIQIKDLVSSIKLITTLLKMLKHTLIHISCHQLQHSPHKKIMKHPQSTWSWAHGHFVNIHWFDSNMNWN